MSIAEAYKSLKISSASEVSEHKQIYDISFEYLSKVKQYNDLKSFHNCIVALINLEAYSRALKLISEVPEDVHRGFVLEKAYVYYKTGNSDLLRQLYEDKSYENNAVLARAMKHIVAQDLYRNGNSLEALELYQDLIKNNKEIDNLLDLACNERATLFQLSVLDEKDIHASTAQSIDETYDLLLNDALIHLSKNELDTAIVLLERASEKCTQSLSDSMSKEDLLVELAPIKLTLAYIYQLTGKKEAALDIMKEVDTSSVNDAMIELIIRNNTWSIKGTDGVNPNIIHRDLNLAQSLRKLSQKLTKPQYQVILKNHLLLSYASGTLSNKSSYFKQSTLEEWIKTFPGDYSLHLYKVLSTLKVSPEEVSDPSSHKALAKRLYKYATTTESEHLVTAAAMALTFVNARQGKFNQSILLLEKLIETQLSTHKLIPGVISTLIYVYERLNRVYSLEELFNKIVGYLREQNVEELKENKTTYNFVRAIACKLLNYNKSEALRLFEVLSDVDSSDKLVRVILHKLDVSSLHSVDQLTQNTPSVDELLAVDLDTLVPSKPQPVPLNESAKKVANTKKRQRKPKFSPSKKLKPDISPDDLDEERWLPLKLRSYYKPSKKQKKKAAGHQGALEPSEASSASSSKNKNKKKKKGKK
ncbi:Piso0_004539 [Millerozyma farinosa CBS 7064]|uniref:Signal recognition particle subunit SRP72 n=1 Tax=Pichia sorbitophila (strain ATCC MYA-4447 / BCRC 22081 / CBS 7064 / NBRC 10061 / NRRL Y-12695) TaxID=559304 RepID=G8Y5R2_PICSO|nr:Piso0_004539 [Millerozyma farinosa CBS 7064]CCE84973.1 Piso0_004539 [Millerozyma farinosa CBS 7064]